jgi:hypothetical protein
MAGTGQTFAFGWIVDMKGGDLGRPFDAEDPEWTPGFDGRVDLLVHAEAAKGYGRNSQSIVDGGALFAFFNNSTVIGGESLLDESKPAKLMTPRVKDASGGPKYYPQDNARYGRGFAVADWKTAGGDPLRILLIGEPNRSLPNPAVPGSPLTLAGVVWALGLPLDPTFDPNDLVAQHQHVWGDEPLFEPAESLPQNVEANLWDPGASDPQDGGRFGAWIIAGRYDPSFPEDQIVICSRERDVTVGGTSYEALGRVYTITLPSESP